MNQCVPSWGVHENPTPPLFPLRSSSKSGAIDVPMLDYEVAELTWENGQLLMHGLGLPRVAAKVISSATLDKPRASGTLESIVNQATLLPGLTKPLCDGDDLVPWFDPPRAAPSNTMTMDATVPCSDHTDEQQSTKIMDSMPRGSVLGTCMAGCSAVMESCSQPHKHTQQEDEAPLAGKRARVAREWSSKDHSVSGSATFGRDGQHVTFDPCDRELGLGFASNSMGSPENSSSAKQGTKTTTAEDHDSVCHSKPQRETGEEEDRKKGIRKSSVSTKSRAAAIHNQSERKRRDKINQRMKTLQKMVPNSSKTDKASMLDEVIEYLKQLQAQVQMMSRMNMSSMMLPMAMQQQLPMSMMPPMGMGMGLGLGMGMGMGMGLDMNAVGRANMAGIPPVLHPSAFMHMTSWDPSTSNDRLQGAPATTLMSDPLSTFLASQSQARNFLFPFQTYDH